MKAIRTPLAGMLGCLLLGCGIVTTPAVSAVAPPSTPLHAGASEESGTLDTLSERGDPPTLEQLVGQKLMVTMGGQRPSAAMLRRVRRGQIGGVVLLARNVTTPAALKRLTRRLQRAAVRGGQPPLLIATDQEGGSVKRVPWAPPTLTAPQMGRLDDVKMARAQGARTGAALRRLGINVDLAPVADIPRSPDSFMFQQGRTFSFDAKRTARLADAFAAGLASRGVLATMKHFPGLGRATRDTDKLVDTITASRTKLRSDLRPYRRAIGHDIPLIMLSNATYSAFDERNAAGWSREIADRLLREGLGFTGVSITDSLNGTAHARGKTVKPLALRAARAGTDMILVTSKEKSSSRLYAWLLARAAEGSIPLSRLETSYGRILALKERL